MFQTFVIMVLGGLFALAMSTISEQNAAAVQPSASALAQNFAVYRTAVISYVQANPNMAFSGSVSNASLPAVGMYVPNPLWRNYVSGNTVIVYAARAPVVNFVGALEQLAQYSVFAGVVYNGTVVANAMATTPSNIVLPAGVASAAPNGVPVWEAVDVF